MVCNKELYRKLCEEKNIPLFMQAWWLDAICTPEDKQWDVLLCEENGEIVGAMPYHIIKKWGFKIILQLQGAQYTGVWIDYPEEMKLHKRYSFEKRVMNRLIDQLENLKVSYFSQNFHHSFTNWQPFYWRGFRQTTRYTYQIKDLSDLDKVLSSFDYSKRARITNEERFFVDFSLSPEDFYNFHKQTLQQRNSKIEYSKELIISIYNSAKNRHQGQMIALKDENDKLHSAIFLVWDKNSAYNAITAIDLLCKSGTASTKMFWEAIKFVSDKTKVFDFEGSMIEGVAQSFQQFGAEQTPYFNISKSIRILSPLISLLTY